MIIVFEGIDTSGKTTQIELLKQRLEETRLRVGISKALPDGPLRTAILGGYVHDYRHVMLLYRIAAEEHFREVDEMAAVHDIVLCDRSELSLRAYQGHGMELSGLMLALDLLDLFRKSYVPNAVVYLKLPYDEFEKRVVQRSAEGKDYIERLGPAFFERALHGFELIMSGVKSANNGLPRPRSNWSGVPHLVFDAMQSRTDIHLQLWDALRDIPSLREVFHPKT